MLCTIILQSCKTSQNKPFSKEAQSSSTHTTQSKQSKNTVMKTKDSILQNQETSFVCKLTTPELQQRKKTVIALLKKQVLETKELANGFAYKFEGTDEMIDLLASFVKTERLCCDFFNYTVSVTSDEIVWLELTGPKGVKDFIKVELELN